MPSLFICLHSFARECFEYERTTLRNDSGKVEIILRLLLQFKFRKKVVVNTTHHSLEEVKTFKLQLIKPLDTTSFFSFWFVKNRRNTIENKFILPNKDREEPKNQW